MSAPKPRPIASMILTVSASFVIAVSSCVFLWPHAPRGIRKAIIGVFSTSKWAEFERLTKMLSLGMPPSEAEQILGKPDQVDTLSLGQRWIYGEDDSTAGWTYVAEFKRDQLGSLRLCYTANIQHRAFPDSPTSEQGNRLELEKPEGTILLGYPPVPKKGIGVPNTNRAAPRDNR